MDQSSGGGAADREQREGRRRGKDLLGEAQIRKNMRRISFDPDQLPDELRTKWENWKRRSIAATESAISDANDGRSFVEKSKVWGELKEFLLQHVFHGKCAYCEARF